MKKVWLVDKMEFYVFAVGILTFGHLEDEDKSVVPIEILDLHRTTTYVGTGLANIFGERTPCKKLADLHPGQGNLLERNDFLRCTKPLFTSQNRVETS
jgi:hypothetical protein